MTKRRTLAALALTLSMLLGFAWVSGDTSVALADPSRPGSSLVGGTIWWP